MDIPALMASDRVVLLPSWQLSGGARLAVWVALNLDLAVQRYADVSVQVALRRFETIGP